jgi:hypothetical protein
MRVARLKNQTKKHVVRADPAVAGELRRHFAATVRDTAALLGIEVPWPEP